MVARKYTLARPRKQCVMRFFCWQLTAFSSPWKFYLEHILAAWSHALTVQSE